MDPEIEMHIGSARCAASRYRGYRRISAVTLEVFFDAPREVVRVEGADDVEYALQEIHETLEVPDEPGVWVRL